MNILYLAHRLPFPPDKGEKIRAYHQILHLARRHEIHLACFTEEREHSEYVEALRRHCASVLAVFRPRAAAERSALRALFSREPLSVAAYRSAELSARVGARVRETPPDAVLVYTAVMVPYARHVNAPRLLDFVDVDSEKWRIYGERFRPPRSFLYAIEARRLSAFEVEAARSFERSAFVSEAESRLLTARVPGLRPVVIPMGVDLEYFHPGACSAGPRDAAHPVAVFVGVMDYFPNSDAVAYFAREIVPLVLAEWPGFEFRIVGRNPAPEVRALARLPGVTVIGAVPDIRPHLAAAALAVAPFRIARGVQSKVLEAMASGLPVVGTPIAFQGIPVGEAEGVRAAADPEGFSREVLALLRDPSLRAVRGAAARRYVEQHHRWDDMGALLESTLLSLVGAGRRRADPGAATGPG